MTIRLSICEMALIKEYKQQGCGRLLVVKDFKYTLYNFTTNRCKEGPLEFFKDYKGYFMSDAYAGYKGIGKPPTEEEVTAHIVTHLACWAHARRYFIDAQKTSPRAAG